MIKKSNRKNPNDFNSAILEKINEFIKESKAELKQESWTNYNDSFIEMLKIMKDYFSKNDEYMNNQLISKVHWLSEKLKEDVWKYTKFD